MKTLGLYIHIPFCLRKCHYCDFVSYPNRQADIDRYVEAVLYEASLYNDYILKRRVDTVFIGGGTPSLLSCNQIKKLTDGLNKIIGSSALEFSIEANPETITIDKIKAYKDAGINRISIGLQTHDNDVLKTIGRRHTYEDFICAYKIAHNYISNINIDVMFGLPGQSHDCFSETVKRVVDFNPSHISCYALKLEEGTKLYECFCGIEDEADREMYHTAVGIMKKAGYIHYETSNFAKPGFECRHNLKYWTGQEYLGLGVAASSFDVSKRWTNIFDLDTYIGATKKGAKPVNESITLSQADKKQEYIMLRLRLSEGISLYDYQKTFGTSFLEENKNAALLNEKAGLIKISETSVKPTLKGFDLQNAVISEFLK